MIEISATLQFARSDVSEADFDTAVQDLRATFDTARQLVENVAAVKAFPVSTSRGRFVNVYVTVNSDSPVTGDELFDELMVKAGFSPLTLEGEQTESDGQFTSREREMTMA